jgi:hypothetical protein
MIGLVKFAAGVITPKEGKAVQAEKTCWKQNGFLLFP